MKNQTLLCDGRFDKKKGKLSYDSSPFDIFSTVKNYPLTNNALMISLAIAGFSFSRRVE